MVEAKKLVFKTKESNTFVDKIRFYLLRFANGAQIWLNEFIKDDKYVRLRVT